MAASPPAAALNSFLAPLHHPLPSSILSMAGPATSDTTPQEEPQGSVESQADSSYTVKVRKPWGLSSESVLRAEQPPCPAASPRQGMGQSPAGKPPLPRMAGKGYLTAGMQRSPRLSAQSARSPSASPRMPSGIPQSTSAIPGLPLGFGGSRATSISTVQGNQDTTTMLPLSRTAKGAQGADCLNTEGSIEPQATPHTPLVSLNGSCKTQCVQHQFKLHQHIRWTGRYCNDMAPETL